MKKSGSASLHDANTPASRIIEVSAGLIFREGRLLIAQRHTGSHLGGLWEFPGGKREPSETFEQCLVRELREELGIEVLVGELLESLTHEYPERTVHLKFFRCRLQAGEPQAIGCAAFKWIDRAGLDAHEFPAADARLLEKLRSTPELWSG
jgi:mutator protein MutT